MEISGNSINQPVNFYTKNTGNTINMAITDASRALEAGITPPEFVLKEKNVTLPKRKRRKGNKRLNTLDTDYIPDGISETDIEENEENIFSNQPKIIKEKKIRKVIDYFFSSIPLVNCFYLKQKQKTIKNAVSILNNINQNVDDLINTAVPIGEEGNLYADYADNLKKAAGLIGKINKKYN